MKTIFLAIVLLIVVSATSFASKISQITLAELESNATYIVLAKVTEVVAEGDQDNVTIKVDSYLKGKSHHTVYTFKLFTRGGLKDFDPRLKKGDSGVFFLKAMKPEGQVEKAYWGSVAVFPNNIFELTEEKNKSKKTDAGDNK